MVDAISAWASTFTAIPKKVSPMKCPACQDSVLLVAERCGVEIDYCPNCRGVWLDRGELDKIIERSFDSERSASRDREYDRQGRRTDDDLDSDPHSSRHAPQRRRSWLSELFD